MVLLLPCILFASFFNKNYYHSSTKNKKNKKTKNKKNKKKGKRNKERKKRKRKRWQMQLLENKVKTTWEMAKPQLQNVDIRKQF
jgi:flagellar biosynthesis component FlhA